MLGKGSRHTQIQRPATEGIQITIPPRCQVSYFVGLIAACDSMTAQDTILRRFRAARRLPSPVADEPRHKIHEQPSSVAAGSPNCSEGNTGLLK
ncbi:hypothetical protein E2C01_015741 [Portunus trituberculatus]|uniref:Uncharacterized protein n=1 Tax=Portunus trituberculatus TaxID=210409 RepID=A0A5B7DMN4_PORTR|nr:hypothetical protein [Portunus trituberculatus]